MGETEARLGNGCVPLPLKPFNMQKMGLNFCFLANSC